MKAIPCPISSEELNELYTNEKFTDEQIAYRLNSTEKRVRTWRHRFGIRTIARTDRRDLTGLPSIEGQLKSLLIGSMLGDGRLTCAGNIARYLENHAESQLDYLLWKKGIWGNVWCPTEAKLVTKIQDDKEYKWYRIHTISHELLNSYFQMFYPLGKGYKRPPYEIVDKVDAFALAIWYLDDGCAGHWPSITFGIQTPESVDVCHAIFEQHGLAVHWKPQDGITGNWEFKGEEQALKFLNIVRPHIPECMEYKIHCKFEGRNYKVNKIIRESDLETLAKTGVPIRRIAKQLGIGATTITRYINNLGLQHPRLIGRPKDTF